MTRAEIIELIGKEAHQKLVAVFGGKQIRISGSPESLNRYATVIGLAKAQILCNLCKEGIYVYVAKKSPDELKDRDRSIIEDYSSGKSIEYLAEANLLSERQIWNILKKPL